MFVLTADKKLVPLTPTQFALEDEFQEMLVDFPDLLCGDLIDAEQPRRWLLISREIGVPNEMHGSNLWSADHLFLDQDGVPTIVEVKRQTDTRLRREVVGQMLDYAANAAAYWPVERVRAAFEARCSKENLSPDDEIRGKLGEDIDSTKFWDLVKTNLAAQKLRLLFVADSIPRDLRRIVEYLNGQMRTTEVLALELKQYAGENNLRTVAPAIYGQTEVARSSKTAGDSRVWTEEAFFEDLASRFGEGDVVRVGRRLMEWFKERASSILYGKGKTEGSITGVLTSKGAKLYPLIIWSNGKIYFDFRDSRKPPFDTTEKRLEFLERINRIPGVKLTPDGIEKQPSIKMAEVASEAGMIALLEALDWFAAQI